ncbi:MAG: 23S rRNA pseudouridine(1911/1915/1917) synthase RluD [Gammaproteobacteria bacterium]|nr:MAG: 23S rRNA pseudouridine(1911/1915/1917) synthase RluD [Gammaproteobacteria bacterium]
MTQEIHLSFRIPEHLNGRRLDQALAELVPDYSRSRLQQWIRDGQVMLDGHRPRTRDRVHGGETVRIDAVFNEASACLPEDIPLDIVYQDSDLLVINKPAGLVVHPAAGNPDGTLQNALLYYEPALGRLPRAGIVHRLDKETSGLMVVARSQLAHKKLVEALQARAVKREYLAVVNSVLTAGGKVDAPIGRHPVDRKRMAVVTGGRDAVTHYRVVERYRGHTLVRLQLETGRTHQIRVHMAHIRCPVVGDPLYGGRLRLPRGANERLQSVLQAFRRQALHATRLAFTHPGDGHPVNWETPLPADMTDLVAALRQDAGLDGNDHGH